MNRKSFLKSSLRTVSAVALASLFASAPALAQAPAKTVIKLGWTTSDGAQDPYAVGARAYKTALEAASKGTIEVQLFPNRQLGDEKPMLEGLRFGTGLCLFDVADGDDSRIGHLRPADQVILAYRARTGETDPEYFRHAPILTQQIKSPARGGA